MKKITKKEALKQYTVLKMIIQDTLNTELDEGDIQQRKKVLEFIDAMIAELNKQIKAEKVP